MATTYRHTQVSRVTIVVVAAVWVLAFVFAWTSAGLIPVAAVVAMGCLLASFTTLTVTVDDDAVRILFGPGLIRRRIALERIRGVSIVRTPWYYGWGIRLTPWGWLWRVYGRRGVELEFIDGRRFRVGSDEPEGLAEALRGKIRAA